MLTRRDFFFMSAAAIAANSFGRFGLLAQGRQGGPQTPITPVFRDLRRNAGYFTGRGGTIGWLVNPSGVVVVDSQFPDSATLCMEGLFKNSGKTEIATLINSHHHGDHTAGNVVFRPKTKQIIAHANVPKYLKSGYDQQMARRAQENPPPATPPPAEPVSIDRTVADAYAFDHGDERVSITHYGPAHTGGDVVIYFEKANVAHMGDLMFNRMHPVIDRPNGASIANWTKVLQQVASELPADTQYIYGHAGTNHGVTGTRADLHHHANYLVALLDYVRTEAKAGKTREQVLASTDIIKGFEDYGPLVQRPLGAAYDEVTAG